MAKDHCAINPRNICKKCRRIFASCSMQISTPNFLPRKLCQSKNVCSNLLSAYRPDLSNINFLCSKYVRIVCTKLQSNFGAVQKNNGFLYLAYSIQTRTLCAAFYTCCKYVLKFISKLLFQLHFLHTVLNLLRNILQKYLIQLI